MMSRKSKERIFICITLEYYFCTLYVFSLKTMFSLVSNTFSMVWFVGVSCFMCIKLLVKPLLFFSHNTSFFDPVFCSMKSFCSVWLMVLSFCARSFLMFSGTWFAIFAASVPSLGEKGNTCSCVSFSSLTRARLSSKFFSDSPGNPTIISLVSALSGRAILAFWAMLCISLVRCPRFIFFNISSDPDWIEM